MSNEYYIYAYLRDDSTPYYIGKVKDRRAWSVCRNIKKPADKSKIVKLYAHLTEEQAYDIEIFLIKFFGRKDINTGILRNLTDGGGGPNGRHGMKHTEESKRKMSEAGKGKNYRTGTKHTEESKRKMSSAHMGKKLSAEHVENIRKVVTGRKFTDEHKQKIGQANKGKKRSNDFKEKNKEKKCKPLIYENCQFKSRIELADFLGIDKRTVFTWIRNGKIKITDIN